VLRRVLAVAVVVLALVVALKDGRLLRTAGLTGSCSVVQQFPGGSELAACRSGKVEGRPDLSHRGCRLVGRNRTFQYWRCPAGFDIGDVAR
jgi:hypothetical protein